MAWAAHAAVRAKNENGLAILLPFGVKHQLKDDLPIRAPGQELQGRVHFQFTTLLSLLQLKAAKVKKKQLIER